MTMTKPVLKVFQILQADRALIIDEQVKAFDSKVD